MIITTMATAATTALKGTAIPTTAAIMAMTTIIIMDITMTTDTESC